MLGYMLPFTGYPYKGEEVDCPVCGSSNHGQIATSDRKMKRLSTQVCHDCGLFFTNPMPTEAELTRYYAATYRAEYQFARFRPSKVHKGLKTNEARFRADQLAQVMDLSQPMRFLDFGTGSGELPRHMASLGHAATGFEPGADFADHAEAERGKATILTGRWQDMGFAPDSFDVITCLHVLEHLSTPVEALGRLREWLAPGGVLFLEVPNMPGYEPKGPTRFHFAHVLGFSRDNLGLAAEKAGFRLLAEQAPTSMFLVRDDDPRAQEFPRDLAGTARRNAEEYGHRPPLTTRLNYHIRRTWRVLAREIGLK